eukprot:2699824-Prymnesium_polylepis.1
MHWRHGHPRPARAALADSCTRRPMINVLQCHWLLSCASGWAVARDGSLTPESYVDGPHSSMK